MKVIEALFQNLKTKIIFCAVQTQIIVGFRTKTFRANTNSAN